MAMRQRIMIVDSDERVARMISRCLEKERFETLIVEDGEKAIREFQSFAPDLITLALVLPDMDGYQVCKEIRAVSHVPIIILSDKKEIFDKVLGLELGADDYMTKPFDERELAARIKAILRRSESAVSQQSEDDARMRGRGQALKIVQYDGLSINLSNYSVTCGGVVMEMPPKEIELLYFLASSPNQVFTREQLLSNIWGYDYAGDTRTVDVHIKRLREKLKDGPNWSISTVWGVGYKFDLK